MRALIIAEHDNSQLKTATLCTLDAVRLVADQVDLLVAGHDCSVVAKAAAGLAGINTVIHCDDASLANHLAEDVGDLVVDLIQKDGERYSHIAVASSTKGKDLLPRIAALLDMQPISDVIKIESADTFVRPIYAGNALATVKSLDSKVCYSVRSSAFSSSNENDGCAEVTSIAPLESKQLSRLVSEEIAVSERPDLAAANVVLSGGRGMGNGENFDMLYRIADKLGGAVGASRAAVDAGFVSNDLQVGQTGKIVAPDLYVAVGISGAIQHLAGMKESKVIVAINQDEDAPIFQVADYGLVGDLFDVLPKLEAALE